MTPPTSENERDERIRTEVIVDAYTPDEQALGWCYPEISEPVIFRTSASISWRPRCVIL